MATAWSPIVAFEKAEHGDTPAVVPGGVYATFGVTQEVVESRDGEDPGLSKQDKVGGRIDVAVFTDDEIAYNTLLNEAESNLVLYYTTAGATARKKTLKNVLFRTLDNVSVPVRGTPTPARFGLHGVCTWGDADTLDTMMIDADVV